MFLHLVLWASLQLAATMSPGPAFAITVRTAVGHHRRAGLVLAFGLGLGVACLLAATGCGLTLLIAQSAMLFAAVKYAGAAYLAWLGIKAIRARPHQGDTAAGGGAALGDGAALRRGFLTNATNPKGLVFYLAVLPQFLSAGTGRAMLPSMIGISTMVETAWFSLVTLVLTQAEVRRRFMRIAHWIERVCGVLLCGLAARLVWTTVAQR